MGRRRLVRGAQCGRGYVNRGVGIWSGSGVMGKWAWLCKWLGVGGSGKEELGAWGSVWAGLCKSRGEDTGVGWVMGKWVWLCK